MNSRECITIRHLLEQTTTKCWLKMREITGSGSSQSAQPRCDSVNSLASNLEKILQAAPKFVLVFDGIDRQRELTPILIPGLARLGTTVRGLSFKDNEILTSADKKSKCRLHHHHTESSTSSSPRDSSYPLPTVYERRVHTNPLSRAT